MIKNYCGSINGIFIDDEKNRCIYLDNKTGYVTETYLSTLCNDRNRLYRYDYSTKTTMSSKITVANSKYFAARGQFTTSCCLFVSGYEFAYNCKINKYCTTGTTPTATNDRESLLSDDLPTEKALTLCIDTNSSHQVIEINDCSSDSNSDTNTANLTATIIAAEGGGMNKTRKSISNDGLAVKITRIYDSQNVLLKKLQSMDKEIKSIQQTFIDQDPDKDASRDNATDRF